MKLIRYRDDVMHGVAQNVDFIKEHVKTLAKRHDYDKKRYALEWSHFESAFTNSMVYRFIEGTLNVSETVHDFIRNHLQTRARIGEVRYLWYNLDWDKYRDS